MSSCKKITNAEIVQRLTGGYYNDIPNMHPINFNCKGGYYNDIPNMHPINFKCKGGDSTSRQGFPGERHGVLRLPDGSFGRANYMGPGTNLTERLKRGDPPRTYTDKVSQAHDIRYALASSQDDVAKADRKMIETLDNASGKDSSFNINLGKWPIKAKYYAESKGLIAPGRIASFGEVKTGDENEQLVRAKLAELESEGFGLTGGCATCKLNEAINFGGGCLSCMGGASIIEEIKNKPEEGLTTHKITQILDLIRPEEKTSIIFGSYRYSPQWFAGDIDMRSIIVGCCTEEVIFDMTKKILQDIPKKMSRKRGTYFGEIKVGYDLRFKLNPNGADFVNQINDLYKKKLLDQKEHNEIMYLHEQSDKDSQDELKELIRNLYVLRWKKDDIKKGSITMRGKKKMKLYDAIAQKTPIKIDIFAIVDNRYIEVSNFFVMVIKDKNNIKILNIEEDKLKLTYIEQMKDEVRKLSSNTFLNVFKMAKRMWLIARANKDEELLNELTPLFQSSIARLNQIKTDISTLLLLLENVDVPPYQAIIDQIDNLKTRIAYVNDIDIDFDLIYELLNNIVVVKTKSKPTRFTKKKRESTIKDLEALNDYLKEIIKINTVKYLEQFGLWPVPQSFYNLPDSSATQEEIFEAFVEDTGKGGNMHDDNIISDFLVSEINGGNIDGVVEILETIPVSNRSISRVLKNIH